jgi:predicted lactoylglutathione lyase
VRRGGDGNPKGRVDEVTIQARATGATILKEPHPADFGGYHACFADPDGHRWDVLHNPGLSVSEGGTVMIGPVDD